MDFRRTYQNKKIEIVYKNGCVLWVYIYTKHPNIFHPISLDN